MLSLNTIVKAGKGFTFEVKNDYECNLDKIREINCNLKG